MPVKDIRTVLRQTEKLVESRRSSTRRVDAVMRAGKVVVDEAGSAMIAGTAGDEAEEDTSSHSRKSWKKGSCRKSTNRTEIKEEGPPTAWVARRTEAQQWQRAIVGIGGTGGEGAGFLAGRDRVAGADCRGSGLGSRVSGLGSRVLG